MHYASHLLCARTFGMLSIRFFFTVSKYVSIRRDIYSIITCSLLL